MKFKYIFIGLIGLSAFTAFGKSDKRGVGENQFSMGSMLEALEPGVTWYYNWGNTPGKGYNNEVIDFEGLEFVPMCWNGNYNADAIWEYCKSHPQTKYLLGFNEPNFTAQANMTPAKAAEEWPAVKALADELGLKLVAPALNYSPNPPYTDPLKWMDEFVELVGLDAFDFTAIHNYGGVGVMIDLATKFHDRYGKDVWVTEFCYWPGEQTGAYVTPETQINSMAESLLWLETTPWIFRYAWFKALGNSSSTSGPNYGLLVHEGTGTDPWSLSEQGKVYVAYGLCDAETWNPIATTVPAAEYVTASMIGLGSTNDTDCGSIIEINRFNAGSSATWQFEIPASGEYNATIKVTGYGEPTRFDPQLQWFIVNGETETPVSEILKPALPNNKTEYKEVATTISLPEGKVSLRIKDAAPYQPSGICISSVRIDNIAGTTGIVDSENTYSGKIFNLQGICVGRGADDLLLLPSGYYIIDHKIVKK